MPRLRRVDCSEPGIRRVRHGRGFRYVDESGDPVPDETRERISELAIPPAWQDVWICSVPNGHLQATGVDAAGRKQYLYHEAWRTSRDRQKFDDMLAFAKALPAMRRGIERDLARRGFASERVLACSLRLLDRGFFRVGSEQYTEENQSFGLTTLRQRHVHFEKGAAVFSFRAKGGKKVVQEVADPGATKLLRALSKREGGGSRLFAYKQGGEWRDVEADDVNAYLKAITGGDFSAKDFRTWNATVLAAVGLANRVGPQEDLSSTAGKRIANEVVKDVAAYLSNTPAVCRASYIDPRVFDLFDSGATIRSMRRAMEPSGPERFADRERIERAVVRLLS